MRAKVLLFAFAVSALVLALVATVALGGDKSRMKASLTGYEEVPAVSSMAHGEFILTIDDENRVVHYTLTLGGTWNSSLLFAHIHLGQRTANGAVMTFLCGGGTKPAPCPANGSVSGDIRPADIQATPQGVVAGEWDEFVAALRAGVTYANVHTSLPLGQPGGEIRGQINDKNERSDPGDREDD
jgi:CHRD domain-containing protein